MSPPEEKAKSSRATARSQDKPAGGDFRMRFSHLDCLYIGKCLRIAAANTLRITSTMITLESPTPILVETHGAERARGKAHSATDTAIIFDHHPFVVIPVNGFYRAGRKTGCLGTLKTDNREVESLRLRIRHDPNTAESRIVQACSPERTGDFTLPATVAFEGIQNERVSHRESSFRAFACQRQENFLC
jgi:hypothetical protein